MRHRRRNIHVAPAILSFAIYDKKAIRVDWNGSKLGYVPRLENHAVAQLLDRGARLSARIVELKNSRNPWERARFEVLLKA